MGYVFYAKYEMSYHVKLDEMHIIVNKIMNCIINGPKKLFT